MRALTPAGVWESRRLPGSGAGVSPDRMLIGSEGILGVITEAWVRVRPRPRFRASAGVRFPDFAAGAAAVRALSQSGLYPTNCRLIDAGRGGDDGRRRRSHALLVLGFESPAFDVEHADGRWRWSAAPITAGRWERRASRGERADESVGSWREAFLRAPYLRDTFVAMGVFSETFETAITWDRFAALHETVMERRPRRCARCAARARSPAASPTSIPTGPRPTSRCWRRRRRGRGARAVGATIKARRRRRRDRRRRHDHPPPRRRARPPALV